MADDHYSENLYHMAQPATPSEREEAVHVSLQDYKALYMAEMLREWAGYHAPTEEQASIAHGYAEYIDKQVRDDGRMEVEIYAHTQMASEVITDAIYDWHEAYRPEVHGDLFRSIEERIIDLWGRQHHETVNADAGEQRYDAPPEVEELSFESSE